MTGLVGGSAALVAACMQAILARRADLFPVTVWVGVCGLLLGLPNGWPWLLWACAGLAVAVALVRRRRIGSGRAVDVAGALAAGLSLHGLTAAFPEVPVLVWGCIGVFGTVVVLALCLDRRQARRQVRWVGEIPIRDAQRPTTSS